MKLTMFIDGSEFKKPDSKKYSMLGWGIVAIHSGGTQELCGSLDVSNLQKGFHEMTALYHAIKYAEEKGFAPSEVSIFADCEWVAHSGFHLTPGNYSRHRGDVLERIERYAKVFYPTEVDLAEKMIDWLQKLQLHKVKGHSFIVDNMRADYLARSAMRAETLDYAEWLKTGFQYWNCKSNDYATHFAPFVGEPA